jgi:multiple sugar transport system permease protein
MPKRRLSSSAREAWLAYALLAPSLLLVLAVIAYPIGYTFATALSHTDQIGRLAGFAGLHNFLAVFRRQAFLAALSRTGLWTLWVVGLTTLISLVLALMLRERFAGRSFFRVVLLLPWATAVTMTTIAWMWVVNGQIGLVSETLQALGWIRAPLGLLAYASSAFALAIAIGVLVSIPFTTAVLLSGLNSIPQELYDAGKVDGATGWKSFRYLTYPFLRPFVGITVVLNVIYVFNSFPIIWTLTGGGPADGTQVLVTYLYKVAFQDNQFGQAAAISVVSFLILLAFSVVFSVQTVRRAD